MVFTGKDIKYFKSGLTADGLGGPMHSDSVSPFALHNVFNIVSGVERSSGKTKYRCIYAKNTSLTETAINPIAYIPKNTVSSTTELYIGFDIAAGIGNGTGSGVAQSIINESTAPDGVRFTNASDASKGIILGTDIPPAQVIAIWLKLVIFLNTDKAPVDGCSFRLKFGNTLPDPDYVSPTTDTIVAITGEMDSLQPFATTVARLKLRTGVNSYIFTGDTTTSGNAITWLNMLGSLKDRAAIAFGPLDNANPTMKNQIVTSLSTAQNSKSLGYSFEKHNNLYIIYMDVTQPFANPSPQYDFIISQLTTAKATASVDFIMVVCNKAFYMTGASNDTALTIDDTLRRTYHKIFTQYGVHVVVCGQTRNYQRHHVLGFNETSTDSPTTFFTGQQPAYVIAAGQKNFGATGNLFINIGTGGMRPLHTPSTPKAYTIIANGLTNTSSIGYLMVKSVQRTSKRGPTLLFIFYEYYLPTSVTSTQGAVAVEVQRDTFSITIR